MWWSLLLLLLCAAAAGPLEQRPITRVDLRDHTYLRLLLGNPGHYLNFRLNYSLSRIELHRPLEGVSRTVERLPSGWHTELFYIGDEKVRLPFVYSEAAPTEAVELLSSPGPFSGTLGLGKYSPLWQYWRHFSFSQQSLLLGDYDSYAQLEPTYLAPMLSGTAATAELNGTAVPMELDPGHIDIYYPHELTLPEEFTLLSELSCETVYERLRKPGECRNSQLMKLHSQDMLLSNGQHYSAIQQSHDGKFRLGKRFLADYMCFCDWDGGHWALGESIYSISTTSMNAFCALLLVTLLTVWLSLALNRPGSEDEWIFLLVIFIEAFTYLTAGITFCINFYGMHWSRYISNFHESSPLATTAFLVYNLAVCSTGFALLFYHTVRLPLFLYDSPQRHQYNIQRLEANANARLFLYLGVALPALWVCVLPGHRSGTDVLFLLFFSTTLAGASLGITLHAALRHYRFFPAFALQTAFYYWFLIFCNVVPAADMLDLHDNHAAVTLLYVALLGVFAPLYILGQVELVPRRQKPKAKS